MICRRSTAVSGMPVRSSPHWSQGGESGGPGPCATIRCCRGSRVIDPVYPRTADDDFSGRVSDTHHSRAASSYSGCSVRVAAALGLARPGSGSTTPETAYTAPRVPLVAIKPRIVPTTAARAGASRWPSGRPRNPIPRRGSLACSSHRRS